MNAQRDVLSASLPPTLSTCETLKSSQSEETTAAVAGSMLMSTGGVSGRRGECCESKAPSAVSGFHFPPVVKRREHQVCSTNGCSLFYFSPPSFQLSFEPASLIHLCSFVKLCTHGPQRDG